MHSEHKIDSSLQKLLEQELDCFQEILDETETFFNQIDSFSLESIVELLNFRQRWIDEINKCESKRRDTKMSQHNTDLSYLEQNIADIARTIVVIDAKILDILQVIKSKYVDEIANMADLHKRVEYLHPVKSNKIGIVDILQK